MARYYAKTRTPSTPADLAKCLADPESAAELFGGSVESWRSFESEYASANPTLGKLAAEASQLELQQALQGGGGGGIPRAIGGTASTNGRNRFYNRRAPGAAIDDVLGGGDYPLARFFSAVRPDNETGRPIRSAIQASMSERIPSSGGFLIPEILRSTLLMLMLESAIVRPRARIVNMDSLRVPWPSVDDTSHTSTVFGGVVGAWTEEAAAITPSAPAFSRLILEARKLAFFTSIPNELIDDAGELLEEWLRVQIPGALTWFEDSAFLTGSGVGEPEGILTGPGAIRVPVGSTNTITYTDIAKAYARIWPPCLKSPNLVWLCAPDVLEQLLKLAVTPLSAGTTQSVAPPAWLTGMQAIDGIPRTLLGHDLIVSEKMPSSGSSNTTTPGALTLADLNYYLIGERAAMQVAVSEQYAFAQDMTSYRCIERVDGRSWIRTPLTPANGGSTLSPIVKIDTTATS